MKASQFCQIPLPTHTAQAAGEYHPHCACLSTRDLILNICSNFVAQKNPHIL